MAKARFDDPEMVENIDHLEANLLAYENGLSKGQDDTARVQFIFRYAHNLKSSLGMLGFSEASALLHKVESCFDLVRNARRLATTDLTRSALLVIDLVRENIQAPEGSRFPDAAAIEEVLGAFQSSEASGDLSVPLPFPLDLGQAAKALAALRGGQRLWLIDKLITTTIDEEFFGMLPCFEQAAQLGDLIEFQPHWRDLPAGQPECVLRLLVASSLDHAAFGALIHDSFREVRPPAVQRRFLPDRLAPEFRGLLERQGFKPAGSLPLPGPSLFVTDLGEAGLKLLGGRRHAGCLVLAAGNFATGVQERLAALDAGADALATDRFGLERELDRLESLFFTGLGGEHDH
jgi:HPt (histidine-containing phosphotransfer) domain-containing protein